MLKKGLIRLIVVVLAGGDYRHYDDHQKKVITHLLKEVEERMKVVAFA